MPANITCFTLDSGTVTPSPPHLFYTHSRLVSRPVGSCEGPASTSSDALVGGVGGSLASRIQQPGLVFFGRPSASDAKSRWHKDIARYRDTTLPQVIVR